MKDKFSVLYLIGKLKILLFPEIFIYKNEIYCFIKYDIIYA